MRIHTQRKEELGEGEGLNGPGLISLGGVSTWHMLSIDLSRQDSNWVGGSLILSRNNSAAWGSNSRVACGA